MLGQSKLTESIWFKLATPGSWVQAYQQPTVGDTIGIEANVTANKINLGLSSGGRSYASGDITITPDTNWHHVVMVYNGTQTGNSNILAGPADF